MKRPFYPFYVNDYEAKTKLLTQMQDLAYRRLLDLYWNERGPLPDNPEAIQVAIRFTKAKDFENHIGPVLEQYFEKRRGRWHQDRMDEEIAKAVARSVQGQKAAQSRWEGGDDDPPAPPAPTAPTNGDARVVEKKVVDMAQAIAMWNEVAKDVDRLPSYNRGPEQNTRTRTTVLARIKETDLQTWGEACAIVAGSPFLRGEVKDWRASLSWLAGRENFDKVLSGYYKADGELPPAAKRTKTDDIMEAAKAALERLTNGGENHVN